MGSLSFGARGEGRKVVLILLVFGGLLTTTAQGGHREGGEDSEPSQSHFVGAGTNAAHVGNHGKYFQYGHQDKDHYDMGHRRGNEHHFIERHEKGSPHHGHVSTKVRWGDKHGGYGEHYYDYHHAGHHDGGDGDGTAPVAEYAEANEEAPQNKESFQNSGTQLALAPTATATQARPWQQSRYPSPSDGFTSPPKFASRVNPVKLPKAQVTSASFLNEKVTEGRLPSSWSPIPSLHSLSTRTKPLTGHQLSRVRRSLLPPTRIFDRARNSIDIRRTA